METIGEIDYLTNFGFNLVRTKDMIFLNNKKDELHLRDEKVQVFIAYPENEIPLYQLVEYSIENLAPNLEVEFIRLQETLSTLFPDIAIKCRTSFELIPIGESLASSPPEIHFTFESEDSEPIEKRSFEIILFPNKLFAEFHSKWIDLKVYESERFNELLKTLDIEEQKAIEYFLHAFLISDNLIKLINSWSFKNISI